jgi:hypothetical protein
MKKLIGSLLVICLVSIPQIAFCTVFVAIRTNKGWVVGGDSLETGPAGPSEVCKIRKKNGIVLVEWGFTKWDNPRPDLWHLGLDVLNAQKGTVEQRNESLKEAVSHAADIMQHTEEMGRGLPPDRPAIMGWAFLDSHKIVGTELNRDGSFRPVSPQNENWGAFGAVQASPKYLDTHLSPIELPSVDEAVSVVRGAFQAELDVIPPPSVKDRTERLVGPPFSIVLISASSIVWKDQGVCQIPPATKKQPTKAKK